MKLQYIPDTCLYQVLPTQGFIGSNSSEDKEAPLQAFSFDGECLGSYPLLPAHYTAIRAEGGQILASLERDQKHFVVDGLTAHPVVLIPYSGLSYILSKYWWFYYNDGAFYLQHTETGEIPWRLDAREWVSQGYRWMCIDEKLFAHCDTDMVRIDLASGEPLWRTALPEGFELNAIDGRHALIHGDRLWMSFRHRQNSIGLLLAVDLTSGERLWLKTPEATGGYNFYDNSRALVSYLGKMYHTVDGQSGENRIIRPGNRNLEVSIKHQAVIGEQLFYIGRLQARGPSGEKDQYQYGFLDIASGDVSASDTFTSLYQIDRFFQAGNRILVNFRGEGVRVFDCSK